MRNRSHFIRNAAIAALAGSTIGAGAGLWSVRDRTTTSVSLAPKSRGGDVVASSAPAVTEAASGALRRPDITSRDRTTTGVSNAPKSPGGDVVASSAPAATQARASAALGRPDVTPRDRPAPAMAVATNGVARPAPPAAAVPADSARDDRQNVLQQARALAERPDVKALVALRDRISRQAGERGDQESAATQQLLREIERYLAEARRLRLKLDGDDLRKLQLANRPPTGR